MLIRFFATLLAAIFTAVPAMAMEVVLASDPWPPYNNEIGSEQEGYLVDIARVVFEAAGHTVVYKNVPWKRAIAGARSGLYTGILGALKKEASDFVYPEEELGQDIIAFYVRKNSVWRFEGAASIEHVSIGVAAGYDYRDWLNTYIQTHSGNDRRVQVVSGIDPLKQNLKKLLYKRIDVLVGNEAAIRYKAKSMGFMNKIRPAGYGREPANLYISFSPNLPESQLLARQLSDGIAELRRYGQLKTILDRYDLDDWK